MSARISAILPLDKNASPRIAVIGVNAQGEPPTCGGSAAVAASADFTSEIDGIKSELSSGATVDYIAELVPDPGTAAWQTGQGSSGLIGQYFNSSDLSGSPVATRTDAELNFTSFNAGNVPVTNPSNFSAVWTGKVQPTISGDQLRGSRSAKIASRQASGSPMLGNAPGPKLPSFMLPQ